MARMSHHVHRKLEIMNTIYKRWKMCNCNAEKKRPKIPDIICTWQISPAHKLTSFNAWADTEKSRHRKEKKMFSDFLCGDALTREWLMLFFLSLIFGAKCAPCIGGYVSMIAIFYVGDSFLFFFFYGNWPLAIFISLSGKGRNN